MERALESKYWINEPMSSKEMDIVIDKVDYMVRMEKLIHNESITSESPTPGLRSRSLLPEADLHSVTGDFRPGYSDMVGLLASSIMLLV